MFSLVLLILAFLLCLIEAFRGWRTQPAPWGNVPHLGWLGLASYFLAQIVANPGFH